MPRKRKRITVDGRETRNRRAARAIERRQKRAFGVERDRGVAIRDRRQQIACPRVALACLDADRALTDRRRKRIERQDGGCHLLEAEPLQAGEREQGRIDLARVEFAQARLHIAAKHLDPQIRPQPLHQRLTAQRRAADHRALPAGPQSLRALRLMKTSRTSSRSR